MYELATFSTKNGEEDKNLKDINANSCHLSPLWPAGDRFPRFFPLFHSVTAASILRKPRKYLGLCPIPERFPREIHLVPRRSSIKRILRYGTSHRNPEINMSLYDGVDIDGVPMQSNSTEGTDLTKLCKAKYCFRGINLSSCLNFYR